MAFVAVSVPAWAAPGPPTPGSADIGLVEKRAEPTPLAPAIAPSSAPAIAYAPDVAPQGAYQTAVTFSRVLIKGMTAYSDAEIRDIYTPHLNKSVTLDKAWVIAAQLTHRYRQDGYFLTRVVVPPQEMKGGLLTLQVIEGYIGEVRFDDPLAKNRIVKQWLRRLISYRPLKAAQIESVLLQLNDLPGVNLRAVLEPAGPSGEPGAVRLVLGAKKSHHLSGQVSADDYASRYLGPVEAAAQLQLVAAPTYRTTASTLTTVGSNEVLFGYVKQEIPLFAAATLELSAAHAATTPGYTLKPYDEVSELMTYSGAIDYSIIRQRQENLTARLTFDSSNIATNTIGGATQTRDRIRVASLGISFEAADRWRGQTTFDVKVAQGLNVLNASPAQTPGAPDNYLSRADARPDFTKFDIDASRLQALGTRWAVLVSGSAQLTPDPLYASEQFGYGGQAFGRAYSDSEITGDEGAEGSLELRYVGFPLAGGFGFTPYGFFDAGKVWNNRKYAADTFAQSGSSAGAGVRIVSALGFAANLGLAWPLSRAQTAPFYGNGKNARPFFNLAYGF